MSQIQTLTNVPLTRLEVPKAELPFVHGLAVVSADGFIARTVSDKPNQWACKEDFEYLQAQLSVGGVCVMGRTTHEMMPNPKRRHRVVFTHSVSEPASIDDRTLLINPSGIDSGRLLRLCAEHGGTSRVFVLGGTSVYDFFMKNVGYSRFDLSIESRIAFGSGLRLFGGGNRNDLQRQLEAVGMKRLSVRSLNNDGAIVKSFERVLPTKFGE